jgi:hypothetical protein
METVALNLDRLTPASRALAEALFARQPSWRDLAKMEIYADDPNGRFRNRA